MATSGIYDLALNVNEAISEAFDLIGQGVDGETLQGAAKVRGIRSANLMIKAWQGQGIHLWSYKEGTLFLKVGQSKYDFRDSSTHAANTWFETTTTAATVAAALSFAVTAATDIQQDDIIGIVQNDNHLFWTTVQRVDSLTVYVDNPITLATLSGAVVYNYRPGTDTAPALIPIARVQDDGVRRLEGTDYEIPINHLSRKDYFNLPNKNVNGTVIQTYYDRQDRAGESSGVFYTWNTAFSSVPVINFTYERKLQILSDVDETLDIPDTAQLAFTSGLGFFMALKYGGVSPQKFAEVKELAKTSLNDFLAFDNDSYPIYLDMGMNR